MTGDELAARRMGRRVVHDGTGTHPDPPFQWAGSSESFRDMVVETDDSAGWVAEQRGGVELSDVRAALIAQERAAGRAASVDAAAGAFAALASAGATARGHVDRLLRVKHHDRCHRGWQDDAPCTCVILRTMNVREGNRR